MNVFIMRGIQGSGKSHWAKTNKPNAFVLSTDRYFIENGVFKYDPTKIGEYHNRTLFDYVYALQSHAPEIVIDNTNVKVFEIAPFYRLAEAFKYTPKIIWVQCPIETAIKRQTHNVPPGLIRNNALAFEPLPNWWNAEIVYNL